MVRNSKGAKKGKSKSKGSARPSRPRADVPMAPQPSRPAVWRPGVDGMDDGEELQFDPTAYDCLHAFRLTWPCLSFDVVRDSLGEGRKSFPHTLFLVAGTQAGGAADNSVAAVRLANLSRMRRAKASSGDGDDGEGSDDDSSSSSSEDEDEDEGEGGSRASKPGAPVMKVRSVAHHGCVNRVRCMPQQPHIAATWSDHGRVQVWDLSPQVRSLSVESEARDAPPLRQAPLHVYTEHGGEGYAVDWSPAAVGRMATGDCSGAIAQWEAGEGGKWAVSATKFTGHAGSVEDIQWSPSEPDVFASAGVDGCVCFWDVRAAQRSAPALRVAAHSADVNVVSWNRLASCMLASGCDDGSFRIWDLRLLREGGAREGAAAGADSFIAHFNHHKQPITAIQWSPHESSTIVTSCADNQITVWDLSLERDTEEEAEFEAEMKEAQAQAPQDLPPQLMFVHQGQSDIKDVHWHPHIPGMLLSTAADGFNVFKASNL